MKTDIVFPSGNESELADLGRRLGFERLIFIYENLKDVKKIEFGMKIDYGVLIKEKSKKSLIKKIDKTKQKNYLVLVGAGDGDFNRFVLEKTRADMLFGLELVSGKDATHYRRSGLDQVLCKIARDKKKIITFSFKEIFAPLYLGRVIQNLRFCRKYKVKAVLGSFASRPEEMKSYYDLSLFLRLLEQKFL